MITFQILLFAGDREKMKSHSVESAVSETATIGNLAEKLNQEYPSIFPRPEGLVFAVNRDYATFDQPISETDEIAIIPPVSGGYL